MTTNGSNGPLYNAESIIVLPGLEAVRQRPALYIGSTGSEGLHHLVYELVENAIDESLAGYCSVISVTLFEDGSCAVEDDGRGIPIDPLPDDGRPACEVVMTTLHAGAKFRKDAYAVSGGLHGVGLSCVNALSDSLALDVWRDGNHARQSYSKGNVVSELEIVGASDRRGTRIHFHPDPSIFVDAGPLESSVLQQRLEQLAFLHSGIHIRVDDQLANQQYDYHYSGGVTAFVKHLNRQRTPLHSEPVYFQHTVGESEVEAALQWTTAYAEDLSSFVNSIHTSHGGTHVDGLKTALTKTVNAYAEQRGLLNAENGEKISGLDVLEGLTCVLSVRMAEPHFGGQVKAELTNPEINGVVADVISSGFANYLEQDAQIANVIVGKALESTRARAAARRASERAAYQAVDPSASEPIYMKQFGIRSSNWHESCTWLTDQDLLATHASMLEPNEDTHLLDVCCGSGVVGASFRERVGKITGLDLTPEMRSLASTRLDEVIAGNVYNLPFEENTFDAVCTREVLHLLPEPQRPLAQIRRVLKPGGTFVVGQILPFGEADSAWMFRVFKKKQPLVFNQWLEHEYRQMLEQAGFVDIQMKELLVWESIDLWIDTWETTSLHRHEIRDLFYNAPEEVRAIHPFEVLPNGEIRDCWRWCVYSMRKA